MIAVIVILLAGFGLSKLFSGMKKEPAKKPPVEAKLYVHARPVEYSNIIPTVKESGFLGSQKKVDLISEVQGKIEKGEIFLKEGEKFNKGEVIARINNEEARNNLMASKSRFLNTLANALPDLKIDFPNSYKSWLTFYKEVDIQKDLPEIPKMVSDKEKTFLSSRNILNEYYTIKSAEVRLKKYVIRAPFKGSFVNVNYEIGSTINPGGKIGTIIQTNKIALEIPVRIIDIKWIQMGDIVSLSPEYSEEKVEGRIVRISDFVQQQTQSISVFINIKPQNKVKLMEGMLLNAEFRGKAIPDVMEIPRNSIFDDTYVYVVLNGKLKKQEIKIHKKNEKTALFSGLTEGQYVVTESLIKASEGMTADIIK